MNENTRTREQKINHLGWMNSQLRGLMGFVPLANEITQNADDAKATELIFDVTEESLKVENNSTFSECETPEKDDCASKSSKLCDIHRFLSISSGNKREEENAIGAFGVGFTSVYQITDKPEIFTGTRHWVIKQTESGGKITQNELSPKLDSTRFVFPWAKDTQSILRIKLEVTAITKADIERFFDEVKKAITDTIMFLKHIETIEIKRNGESIKRVRIKRNVETKTVTITVKDKDEDKIYSWYLFRGNFDEEAKELKNDYPNTRFRKTEVSIAIPKENLNVNGKLFAYLPTEETTGLPFHINADFFPDSTRKRIIFGNDYQSKWNRLAIRKVSEILTEQLPNLTDKLGHKNFWRMIENLQKVDKSGEDNQKGSALKEFWEKAKCKLTSFASVYNSKNEWIFPSQTFILKHYKTKKQIIPILEELSLKIIHEELYEFRDLLKSENVGVELFKLIDLADALLENGLNDLVSFNDAPNWLQQEHNQQILADEIKCLLEDSENNEVAKNRIRKCAIAKSCNGNFDTLDSIYKTDKSTREIFSALDLDAYFLADENPQTFIDLTDEFTIEEAIEVLQVVDQDRFTKCLEYNLEGFKKLIHWLVDKSLVADDHTKQNLRSLKIWLSSGKLSSLGDGDLVVPGDFTDPLKLASIVDLDTLGISSQSLLGIGATKLTFVNYVTKQLPSALKSYKEPKVLKVLVNIFVEKRNNIKENADLQDVKQISKNNVR